VFIFLRLTPSTTKLTAAAERDVVDAEELAGFIATRIKTATDVPVPLGLVAVDETILRFGLKVLLCCHCGV
jgi:hypothetical protein